jgi:hypothetical protein
MSPQIRVRLPLNDSSKIAPDDEHYLVMAQNVPEAYKDAQRGGRKLPIELLRLFGRVEPVTC